MMDEMEALKAELEHYRTEKDKIRDLVGRIGGRGSARRNKVINTMFLVLVTGAFAFQFLRYLLGWHETEAALPSLLVVELAILLVSLKIIWMIHTRTKVDHFQFWILHSIEFQMTVLSKRMHELSEVIKAGQGQAKQSDSPQ